MSRRAVNCSLLVIASLALWRPAAATTNAPARAYPGGAQIALELGADLYAALDKKFQQNLSPDAVVVESSEVPVIAPVPKHNDSNCLCQLYVSQGFISLINHIAHAKAIDRVQPGYFLEYISALGQNQSDDRPPAPCCLDDARFWTDDVMQDQASLFNQMIGMTLAINLTHQYLGHNAKYAAYPAEEEPEVVTAFMSPGEWEASIRYATLNSLDCALATEGAQALFDCIDQMPRRPSWAGYILPEGVDVKKLNQQLSRFEYDYFHGGSMLLGQLALGG